MIQNGIENNAKTPALKAKDVQKKRNPFQKTAKNRMLTPALRHPIGGIMTSNEL